VPREHIRVVEPTHHKKDQTVAVIRHELAYDGLSVIIARRACVTYAKEIKAIKEIRAIRSGEIGVVAE
jgi:indolepyruvate ferredoxin oxidoreductase alpha subunit